MATEPLPVGAQVQTEASELALKVTVTPPLLDAKTAACEVPVTETVVVAQLVNEAP